MRLRYSARAQLRLIELLTYIQVARDKCGLLIDVDVLRLTARQSGIDFNTAAQRQARDDGLAAAERAFTGHTAVSRMLLCAPALRSRGRGVPRIAGAEER